MRIHVLGASGSGTSTLGLAIAESVGCRHLDSDDYFWIPSVPPFRESRPKAERQALLDVDAAEEGTWVLSGSLCSWGDFLFPRFQLVVFLWLPTERRLTRLRARELARHGEQALSPGGSMHGQHCQFMDWAAAYDSGDTTMRSMACHQEWLGRLSCPILRLEGEMDLPLQLERVLSAAAGLTGAESGQSPRSVRSSRSSPGADAE